MTQNPSCRFANVTLSMLKRNFLDQPHCSTGNSINCACEVTRNNWFLPVALSRKYKLYKNDTSEMSLDNDMSPGTWKHLLNLKSSKVMGSISAWSHDDEDNERNNKNNKGRHSGNEKSGRPQSSYGSDDNKGGKGYEDDDDDDDDGFDGYYGDQYGYDSGSKSEGSKSKSRSGSASTWKSKHSQKSKESQESKDIACEFQLGLKDKRRKLDWSNICR